MLDCVRVDCVGEFFCCCLFLVVLFFFFYRTDITLFMGLSTQTSTKGGILLRRHYFDNTHQDEKESEERYFCANSNEILFLKSILDASESRKSLCIFFLLLFVVVFVKYANCMLFFLMSVVWHWILQQRSNNLYRFETFYYRWSGDGPGIFGGKPFKATSSC